MLKGHGFLNIDWIFGELAYELKPLNQEEFDKSNTVLCAVATNAQTGKPEYFYPKSMRNGCDELKALFARCYKGVEIGGTTFLTAVLLTLFRLKERLMTVAKAVVILTQHKSYVKEPMNPKVQKIFKNIQNRRSGCEPPYYVQHST